MPSPGVSKRLAQARYWRAICRLAPWRESPQTRIAHFLSSAKSLGVCKFILKSLPRSASTCAVIESIIADFDLVINNLFSTVLSTQVRSSRVNKLLDDSSPSIMFETRRYQYPDSFVRHKKSRHPLVVHSDQDPEFPINLSKPRPITATNNQSQIVISPVYVHPGDVAL